MLTNYDRWSEHFSRETNYWTGSKRKGKGKGKQAEMTSLKNTTQHLKINNSSLQTLPKNKEHIYINSMMTVL